ncbi:dTMP kinase [Actinomadura barringtoniae]|uniref:Thymidylate kinase n=1 Tax=Actinomadura barringtoniae TaxID=1427535 RepID=A0A939T682_9ACTN|nr:dTMP kinase [Actinomadura barringtoniae]MBO2451613.1 dTMP kinase [Actinomadura barringtoniae]
MTRSGASHPHAAAPPSGVSSITPFRRLMIALSLSSLGHWLSVLALTAMAGALTRDRDFQGQAQVIGAVLVAMLLPAVLLAPLAGALAARLDRRLTMIGADVLRFALLVSVPLVDSVPWTLASAFLVACVTLLWIPVVGACGPGMVPEELRDDARRAGRLAAYGTAPLAAVLFSILALIASGSFKAAERADLPLYVTAVVFLGAAAAVAALRELPTRDEAGFSAQSAVKLVFQGLQPERTGAGQAAGQGEGQREGQAARPGLHGLALALVGVSLAGGAVVAVAKVYAHVLGGGDAGYGSIAAGLSIGLAFGAFLGPRIFGPFSRRRLLGLSVLVAALALVAISLIQNLVVVVFVSGLLGLAAGVAWSTGNAVASEATGDRERSYRYLGAVALITGLLAAAAVPPLAGVLGDHHIKLGGDSAYDLDGAGLALLIIAVLGLVAGLVSYRRLDDRRGIPLLPDLAAALHGNTYTLPEQVEAETATASRAVLGRGVFIAFEGGEGAGKTTQSRLAAIWLRDHGFEVVTTREPGATKTGMRLRALLLDKETTGLSDRAETLLYAADRADHVANVIRPAMDRGAIVVSDRFVDSSLAYQGYGRRQPVGEIAQVNSWATAGLVPDLTVLLELPPEDGLGRITGQADRIESEPYDFHDRVLRGFRALAEADPDRYLILDASRPQAEISREIQDRIRAILPDPIPASTEDITSTFPAITDA